MKMVLKIESYMKNSYNISIKNGRKLSTAYDICSKEHLMDYCKFTIRRIFRYVEEKADPDNHWV